MCIRGQAILALRLEVVFKAIIEQLQGFYPHQPRKRICIQSGMRLLVVGAFWVLVNSYL